MVRIQTASRLHFGLLSLAPEGTRWPDRHGLAALPARRFGGVGLMVELPGIRLWTEPADAWSVTGPLADRALTFAHRFVDGARTEGAAGPPCRIVVEEASPEHVGLGTGTQLGLAVGHCLATEWGLSLSAEEIARHVGRGDRSALGIHGFEQGGFLVEGGQASPGSVGPLIARHAFPASWRIVLARPAGSTGAHGLEERSAMNRLAASPAAADVLCRLVLLGMLPALVDADIDTFGDALFDFNARAGEAFASFQGGIYAAPKVERLVQFLRGKGVRGVGQSSWGPTVFAVVECEEEARDLAGELHSKLDGTTSIVVTGAANRGARLIPPAGPA
jgi:beta-ribofuranosylaminobenzene 5'-phosphate synthase